MDLDGEQSDSKTFDIAELKSFLYCSFSFSLSLSLFLLVPIRFNDYNMLNSLKGFKVPNIVSWAEIIKWKVTLSLGHCLLVFVGFFIVILQHDINNCLPCNCPRNIFLFVYWWKGAQRPRVPPWPQRLLLCCFFRALALPSTDDFLCLCSTMCN